MTRESRRATRLTIVSEPGRAKAPRAPLSALAATPIVSSLVARSLPWRALPLLTTLLLAAALGATPPDPLPLAPLVRDPVFAVLLGHVRANLFGLVSREQVEQSISGQKRKSRLPWQSARDFSRVPGASPVTAGFTLRFERPLDVSIPYSILWYHPGRIVSSATLRAREWHITSLPVTTPNDWRGGPLPLLTEVHLFALDEGELLVDIDGWLDAVLGGALDDTRMGGLGLAQFRGREYGFGFGHNRKGFSRIGVFDLTDDAVIFPISPELRAANRTLRRELERLATAEVAR